MAKGLALAALAALAACGGGSADAPCPRDPSFDRSRVFQVRLDRRPAVIKPTPLSELRQQLPDSTAGRLQGLTSVEHNLAVRSRLSTSGDAPACAWFDEVVVDLTPAAVEIAVPSEYPPGSCEYEASLAHEREHETTHFDLLQDLAAQLRAALAAADWLPTRANPARVRDRAAAEKELQARIGRVVRPRYEAFREELSSRQAALDAPALYDWVRKRCRHWK